ncbi:MAG: TorF family putative porin [Xanthomonadales bacterium]|nr:TorF family putative porin [Xanthomonadales bacterium]
MSMKDVGRGALFFAILFGVRNPAAAEWPAVDTAYSVAVVSDYLFRGVSQSRGKAAVQGSVDISHASGIYGSLWASTVDFTADGSPPDGADLEVDLYLGVRFDVGSNVAGDISWVQYRYPGTYQGIDYDYSEWLATVYLGERISMAAGYSNDVFNSDKSGWYAEAGFHQSLPRELSLALTMGHYELDQALGDSYQYGSLTLAGRIQQLNWTLGFTTTAGAELFDPATTGSRWSAAVRVDFGE